VTTFRAEDPFDYRGWSRAPNDAPSITVARDVRVRARVVSQLGERTRGRMLVLFTNLTKRAASAKN
jgi:hypothetical protein